MALVYQGPDSIALEHRPKPTVESQKLDASRLITHRFKLNRIIDAYDTFSRAAETKALKVIIEA